MAGLAAAAEMTIRRRARRGNFIPELFHCSGFAVMNSATTDGTLYHGRVLDYAVDWQLQDHAVLIVCEPDGGIPFVNVSYAGFIGSVTGMNAGHVSIGEMGGGGQGHWDGMPMAAVGPRGAAKGRRSGRGRGRVARPSPHLPILLRHRRRQHESGRRHGSTLGQASQSIEPGEAHPLLPKPVKDCVLLSAGRRYEELARRAEAGARQDRRRGRPPFDGLRVALKSNLHDVLFAPASTKFWVANASSHGKPAADQPYHAFQLTELLARRPDPSAREIPLPQSPRTATAKPAGATAGLSSSAK